MRLWTVGYGAWPAPVRADRLISALVDAGVTLLADVRHAPCSSDPDPARPYGPKSWNLQATADSGLVSLLSRAGIRYEWLVELGNPQRRDPSMSIHRAHLADSAGNWPVHRGLALLAERVRGPGASVAILCACDDFRTCHRSLIARELADRHFGGALEIAEIGDRPRL